METQNGSMSNFDGLKKKNRQPGIEEHYNSLLDKVLKVEEKGNKRKKAFEKTKTIDSGTGEILSDCSSYLREVDAGYFCQLSGRGALEILALRKKSNALCLYIYLLADAEYDTNLCRLTKADKENISKSIGMSVQSLKNALVDLSKMKYIINYSGLIFLNPLYSWRGSRKSHVKTIEKWCNSIN